MKTIKIILTISLLSFFTSNAQITKGNWMVGGNARYYISNAESTFNGIKTTQSSSGLNLAGTIGYFPFDKFSIGLSPSFGFNNPEGSNNSGTGYGIGPYVRYYFLKPENRINIFSHIEYNYGLGYSSGEKTSSRKDFNIMAGPAIFFNSSVALELTMQYNISESTSYSTNNSKTKFNNFNIGIGFQIHLEK